MEEEKKTPSPEEVASEYFNQKAKKWKEKATTKR